MQRNIAKLLDKPQYHRHRQGQLELNLRNKNIVDCEIKDIISFLEQHPEFKSLNLDDNNITDIGAKELASKLTTIETLQIISNYISDISVKAFVSNTSITTLKFRNLEYDRNDIVACALANITFDSITNTGLSLVNETNPNKRAAYGREAGIQTEVPSLERLCLFAVNHLPNLDQSLLSQDLKDRLAQPKV